jgi:hypothetical protein
VTRRLLPMPTAEQVRNCSMGFGSRRVMRALYLEGCNAEEIAEHLGVTADYVRWSIRLLPPPRASRRYERRREVQLNFRPNGWRR